MRASEMWPAARAWWCKVRGGHVYREPATWTVQTGELDYRGIAYAYCPRCGCGVYAALRGTRAVVDAASETAIATLNAMAKRP